MSYWGAGLFSITPTMRQSVLPVLQLVRHIRTSSLHSPVSSWAHHETSPAASHPCRLRAAPLWSVEPHGSVQGCMLLLSARPLKLRLLWQHPAASAVFHESPRILLAAVKFFLGQDEAGEGDSDDEGEDGAAAPRAVNPTKAEMYSASKKVWLMACLHASGWCGCPLDSTEAQPMEMASPSTTRQARAACQASTTQSNNCAVNKTSKSRRGACWGVRERRRARRKRWPS